MRRFSTKVNYDPALDPATWDGFNPLKVSKNVPSWKKELNGYKSGASKHNQNISATRKSAASLREEAEMRTADLVRKIVAALEFSMRELMEVRAPSNYTRHVNQFQIHNALFHLKTKCGVKFTDSEFDPYAKKEVLDR